MYNIFVNDHLIAENVLKCDLNHKIEIIQYHCKLEKDLQNAVISVTLNNSETIA